MTFGPPVQFERIFKYQEQCKSQASLLPLFTLKQVSGPKLSLYASVRLCRKIVSTSLEEKVNPSAKSLSFSTGFIPEGFIYYDQIRDKFENVICFTSRRSSAKVYKDSTNRP